MITVIQGGTVVAFDGQSHRLINNGVIVYEDDRILYVGKMYDGEVDQTINACGRLVCPGFINTLGWAALDVPLRLDGYLGARNQSQAYVVDGAGTDDLRPLSGDDFRTVAQAGMVSLLKGGSTTTVTVTAMDPAPWESPMEQTEALAQVAGELGARAYISHNYRSGAKYFPAEGVLRYQWNEKAGRAGLANAVGFARQCHGSYDGRIQAMLFPYTLDTSSDELLRATKEAGQTHDLIVHLFAAQSLFEYHEIKRRTGQTPIGYLYDIGFLDQKTHVVHAMFTTAHPHSGSAVGDMGDVELLAQSGATVVHQPVIRARFGELLYSFARYQRAGVNVSIGTDEFPMDMINEMRFAALMGKVADHDHLAVTARDVFNAATLNGAKALGRDDLGRLAVGAKADIVLVDLRRLDMGLTPGDPIKTLVYMADYHDIETVIIDGRVVVENGRVPDVDEEELAAQTRSVLEKQTAAIVGHSPTGMSAEEIFPPSFQR